MRPVVKRGLLVVFLFMASAYCLLGVWATAELSAYNDPTAARRAYTWLGGSIVLGAVGLWHLIVLLKKHGREELL